MGLRDVLATATATAFTALGDIPAEIIVRRPAVTAFNPATGKYDTPTAKLNGAITATATTITLKDLVGTWVATGGVVKIGTENLFYASLAGNQITGCVRGYQGTTAASAADSAAAALLAQDFQGHGILTGYNDFLVDGTRIKTGDRKLSLRQAEIPIAPATSDKIIFDGKTWGIVVAQTDAAAVLWKIQVRG